MSKSGLDAIDILINEYTNTVSGQNPNLPQMLSALAMSVLEALFNGILDYQALIDSHFRYLFTPKTEWAKFTKMVIFMRLARTYIVSQEHAVRSDGYYHDLAKAGKCGIEIGAIGTSNYNSLLERFAAELELELPKTIHLNGGVTDYYNPYTNDVVNKSSPEDVPNAQLHVPFILTQSGLKPLTSVSMSRRYVELFDQFKSCDALVAVGFGFNSDDSHINGMFRKLIEEDHKILFWVVPKPTSEGRKLSELLEKLRLPEECRSRLRLICVDRDSRKADGILWLEKISNDYPD